MTSPLPLHQYRFHFSLNPGNPISPFICEGRSLSEAVARLRLRNFDLQQIALAEIWQASGWVAIDQQQFTSAIETADDTHLF